MNGMGIIFVEGSIFVLLASSILDITWLNLSNDVYDLDTGIDKDKKELVVNLVSSVMNHFPLSGTVLSASILVGFAMVVLAPLWIDITSGKSGSKICPRKSQGQKQDFHG